MNGLDIITNSRIESYQRCKQYHHNSYVLGVRQAEDEKLRIGTAIHLGTDLLSSGKTWEEAGDAVCDLYQAWVGTATSPELADALLYEYEKVIAMLDGWHRQWSSSPIKTIASEQAFRVNIINPDTGRSNRNYTYGGKIDSIVQLEDGRLAILERKTVGEDITIGSDYWKWLRIDGQISRYMIAARHMGYDVATVLYDVLRKPLHTPNQIPLRDDAGFKIVLDESGNRIMTKDGKKPRETADKEQGWFLQTRPETPAEYGTRVSSEIAADPVRYYARYEIPRPHDELLEAEHELWQVTQAMHFDMTRDFHPRNSKACKLPFKCPFFEPCTSRLDLSTETPEGFRRLDFRHPELEQYDAIKTSDTAEQRSSDPDPTPDTADIAPADADPGKRPELRVGPDFGAGQI